jgi:hypothetical protein
MHYKVGGLHFTFHLNNGNSDNVLVILISTLTTGGIAYNTPPTRVALRTNMRHVVVMYIFQTGDNGILSEVSKITILDHLPISFDTVRTIICAVEAQPLHNPKINTFHRPLSKFP